MLIHKMKERASHEDICALADVAEMLLDNIKESEPGFINTLRVYYMKLIMVRN
jgi:hypothetical protein